VAITDHNDTVFIPIVQEAIERLGLSDALWFFPGIEVTSAVEPSPAPKLYRCVEAYSVPGKKPVGLNALCCEDSQTMY
jgi:hypothetical protein